ncbi:MAG: hypothetical protein EBS89_08455 [Proteobacteria bacterium]|nr:hypothetical protein [Pseudomonadota bacterium]
MQKNLLHHQHKSLMFQKLLMMLQYHHSQQFLVMRLHFHQQHLHHLRHHQGNYFPHRLHFHHYFLEMDLL